MTDKKALELITSMLADGLITAYIENKDFWETIKKALEEKMTKNLKLPKGTAEIGDYILYKEGNKYYELKVRGYQYCPSDCGWRYLTNDFSPTIDNENIVKWSVEKQE